MKIAAVETFLLEAKLTRPFANSRGFHERRANTLLALTTDSGITGWGEAFGPARMSFGALEMLKPMLIGLDPLATEEIWLRLYSRFREHGQKGPLVDALSAIDIALWDIKGKHFDQPIYRLMGGPLRTEVPAYASGLFMRRDGDPEKYLAEEAASYVEQGFGAMKMKVGFGVDYDSRGVRAIRRAIGDKPLLMVDANEAYDTVEAIRVARRIEQYDITWFEEPVPPDDLAGYRDIRRATSIPIAGGEAEFTRFGFREILATRAMDIIQPDIAAAGGLSECKKISDMAQAFGIRCYPHVWGTPIAIAASLHWLAVLAGPPASLNPVPPMLELDMTEHGIRAALLTDALRPRNGMMKIPDGPGLGIEIDRAALQRFQVA